MLPPKRFFELLSICACEAPTEVQELVRSDLVRRHDQRQLAEEVVARLRSTAGEYAGNEASTEKDAKADEFPGDGGPAARLRRADELRWHVAAMRLYLPGRRGGAPADQF